MEEKDEKVVEETTQETTEKVDETKFDSAGDDSVIKVDLSKPLKKEEDATGKQSTNEVPVRDESKASEEVREQNVEKKNEESTGEKSSDEVQNETPVLEEITEDSTEEEVNEVEEKVEEAVAEAKETGKPLPENIQKLVDFMEETGGDIQDYVKLNQDYSKLNDNDIVFEYYKQTKPHLTNDEINFLMEDTFNIDEEEDTDREIKRKKLAFKEQVASARSHLDGQKSKYYEEIKAGSKLTKEQQKAVDFFNRYNKESEATQKTVKKNSDIFTQKTNQVFNDKFKGFEYNVGDKKYRFNVNNAEEIKIAQSDINNFTKKFLDKNSALTDAKGYHKSLFTAMNADAVKDSVAKSKNVDMSPRQTIQNVNDSDIKVRVLKNESSGAKFKFKKRK